MKEVEFKSPITSEEYHLANCVDFLKILITKELQMNNQISGYIMKKLYIY